MNKNCLEYNYTQAVRDGEGWIMYFISFPFYWVWNTCVTLSSNQCVIWQKDQCIYTIKGEIMIEYVQKIKNEQIRNPVDCLRFIASTQLHNI